MCGIAGFHLKDPDYVKNSDAMEGMVDELFRGIEPRGKHATGIVSITRADGDRSGSAFMEKDAVPASDFVKIRKKLPNNTRTALLHTRYWTKGSPSKYFNNHPIVFGSCFAVHNGSIDNDDELFKRHSLSRGAEVDSEAIPAMLATLGWNKLREALEELEGVFAIAAVDPVVSPGKLLLAKGQSSPLVVVENDKFVVWASSEPAIRDAWGKVLGTPPKKSAFRYFNAGEAMLLNGNEKEEFRFDAYKHSYTRQSWNGWEDRTKETSSCGVTTVEELPPPKREARGVVTDRRVACRNLRDSGNGKARIRDHWARYNDDDLADYKGTIRWVHCGSCSGHILVKDMVVLDGEGTVCIDCKELAEGKARAEVFPGVSVVLTGERLNELATAARQTSEVHLIALNAVVRKTGMMRREVEYLLWHADYEMLQMTQNKDLCELAAELEEMYREEIGAAWLKYESSSSGMSPAEAATPTTVQGDMCRIHGLPTSDTEKCWKCVNKGIEDAPLTPLLDDVARCPDCKKFINVNIGCVPCRETHDADPINNLPVPTPSQRVATMLDAVVEAAEVENKKTRCCRCIHPATVFINDGKLAQYCSRCFNTCTVCSGVEKKPADKQGPPNHICRDKTRVCHRHARGKEGVIADGQIAKMGFEIAFASNYDKGAVRVVPAVTL